MYLGVELRMLETAIMKRWLTEDLKQRAIKTITMGLESTDERIRMRAAQCVIAMEAQNQKDEHRAPRKAQALDDEQLASIARDVGVDPDQLFSSRN